MKTEPIPLMLFSNAIVRAGAEEVTLHLLRGLNRKLFRVHLACTPQLHRTFQADIPDDVAVSLLSLDFLSDLRGAVHLGRSLLRHRIQILHSHMFRASLFASPLARLLRVPVVIDTSHGREFWRSGWKKSFRIDRFVARQVDYTIAVSCSTARYLIEQKRLNPKKVQVICNGVNLERHNRSTASKAEIRRLLNLDQKAPLLIVVGRLEPQKGHRILLEAMPAIRKEFPAVQLVCLGEGSLRPVLEQMVKSKDLESTVQFAGYQEDISRWLECADLSVLPSLYEGLPMAALESLAAECPIVATAVDGTPEVVVPGETGLLVPPGDPEQLAGAIVQMLRRPELAREMGKRGRQLVLDQFSVERMVRRTEALYLKSWDEHLERSHDLAEVGFHPSVSSDSVDHGIRLK